MSKNNVINESHYLAREFVNVEEFLKFIKSIQYDFWETKTKKGFTYWLFNNGTLFIVKTQTSIESFEHEPKQTTVKKYIPFKVKCSIMTLEQIAKCINSEE